MKSFFIKITALLIALMMLVSGCSKNNPDDIDPGFTDIQSPAPYNTLDHIPPNNGKTNEPTLEPNSDAPTEPNGDADSAYQELIKLMNSSIERLSALIIGLFTAYGEERENGVLAIIFRAVDMEIDYLGIAVHIAEQIRPYVAPNLSLMRDVGITDPQIVLEFQDMIGDVIYTRVVSWNEEAPATQSPASAIDLTPPPETASSKDAILRFIQLQQATIAKVREQMAGMGTFSIEAKDSSTIACVVNITDKSISDKVTEEKINDEVIPLLRGTFAQYVPTLKAMGVENPKVIVEAYNPDGELLLSTEIT